MTSGCSFGNARAVEAGEIGLAIIAETATHRHGENVLESKTTFWIEGDSFDFGADKPVPLAILDRGCWWSGLPCEVLNE